MFLRFLPFCGMSGWSLKEWSLAVELSTYFSLNVAFAHRVSQHLSQNHWEKPISSKGSIYIYLSLSPYGDGSKPILPIYFGYFWIIQTKHVGIFGTKSQKRLLRSEFSALLVAVVAAPRPRGVTRIRRREGSTPKIQRSRT